MKNYLREIDANKDYKDFLTVLASLSNLFADSATPYLDYRIVENLFCKCFKAQNLARACHSYDALMWGIGVGLKTFTFQKTKNAAGAQKVAEFDRLSSLLKELSPIEKARKISDWRNSRIDSTNAALGLSRSSIYHIVARTNSFLRLFVVPYDPIDLNSIRIIKGSEDTRSLVFADSRHEYSYNYSKSTLSEKFVFPKHGEYIDIPVLIHPDPYELLRRLMDNSFGSQLMIGDTPSNKKRNFFPFEKEKCVILPLYSTRGVDGALCGEVPKRSGLNQWNALGRLRDPNEIYIPVPISVHRKDPRFFPDKYTPFKLRLPNGKVLSAKMCQAERKGLMSNPNKELGKWLLREVLKVPVGTLVTRRMLDIAGFDSVIVVKESNGEYRMELSSEAHYAEYVQMEDGFASLEG